MAGMPQISTVMVSRAKGIQARATRPSVRRRPAPDGLVGRGQGDAGPSAELASWSNRQIFLGFQKRRTRTPAAMLDDGGDDVDELEADEVRPEELDGGECAADDQERDPDGQGLPPARHGPDQPERDQHREQGEDPARRSRSAPRRPGRSRRPGSATGVPIPPQATGAVLAIRHSRAAWNGRNPSPTRNAAEIATGAPKPAAPSMNAPNENATSTAWSRRSAESLATEAFITSNWPVLTARS